MTRSSKPLTLDQTYPCPVCRHGQIESMVLMETFACNFCRHILTANLHQQSVQTVDQSRSMGWQRTGNRWRRATLNRAPLSAAVWSISVVLIVFPAGLLWLSSQIFPPLTGSPGESLPQTWTMLTLGLHSAIAAWILVEHYQLPGWLAAKIYLNRYWQSRRS